MKKHQAIQATANEIFQMSELDYIIQHWDSMTNSQQVTESAALHDDLEYKSFLLEKRHFKKFQKQCAHQLITYSHTKYDQHVRINISSPQNLRAVRLMVESFIK